MHLKPWSLKILQWSLLDFRGSIERSTVESGSARSSSIRKLTYSRTWSFRASSLTPRPSLGRDFPSTTESRQVGALVEVVEVDGKPQPLLQTTRVLGGRYLYTCDEKTVEKVDTSVKERTRSGKGGGIGYVTLAIGNANDWAALPTSLADWASYQVQETRAQPPLAERTRNVLTDDGQVVYDNVETHETGAFLAGADLPLPLPASGTRLVHEKMYPYGGPRLGRQRGGTQERWDLQGELSGGFLWFDGVQVALVNARSGKIRRSWPAFSGRPRSTAGRSKSTSTPTQHNVDNGPTPEGLYGIATYGTTSRDTASGPIDWLQWTYQAKTWGLFKTELVPLADTNTLGRRGMYVHGGGVPGSAGCIDLVNRNDAFHQFLQNQIVPWQSSMRLLLVEYLPVRVEMPRTHDKPDHCPDPGPSRFCVQNPNCSIEAEYRRRVPAERAMVLTDIIQTLATA